MKLKNLRREIDTIDNSLIQLLNKRASLSLEIGKIKLKLDKGIYSPEREKQVLSRLTKLSNGPLNREAIEAIYREIMSSSLAMEKPLVIAYMGPKASFSHQAALKKFGSLVNYAACDTISDCFNEVEKGNCDYGVVPIENSIEGAVTHTMDMLVDADLKICAQIILEIAHNLLSKYSLKSLTKVYSNPQVFGQCRQWLKKNLPKAECIEVTSTTRAAQICAKENNSACIASLLAAEVYGLKVLAKDIEDIPHNVTRFLVIGKEDVSATGEDKTSIVFSIKDKVGALHDMLVPFRKYKINLTRIESRPSKKKAWDYYFFVDLKGHSQEKNVKAALNLLEDKCKYLKILGSYPDSE